MQQGLPAKSFKDVNYSQDDWDSIKGTTQQENNEKMNGTSNKFVIPDMTSRFETWIDSKIKIDALFEINKRSDIVDDWQWVQDNIFELQPFYKEQTVDYVCHLFKLKWLNFDVKSGNKYSKFDMFNQFRHASPIAIQIIDKLSLISNKLEDSTATDLPEETIN